MATAVGSHIWLPDYNHLGGVSSSLLTGLVSSWPLSADGTDEYGAFDLTNNNTVTFIAKGVGAPANLPDTVAHFTSGANQSLTYSGEVVASATDRTVALWVKLPDTLRQEFFSIKRAADWTLVLGVDLNSGGANKWSMYSSGSYKYEASATAAAGWHLVVVTYEHAAVTKTRFYVDDTEVVTHTAADPGAATVWAFGRTLNSDTKADVSLGLVWSRVISSGERACLYAAGAAVQYPFTGVCPG